MTVKYLLDTCVLSEPLKPRPEARVIDWLRSIPLENLFISVLSVGEISKGIAKLGDTERARSLQAWVETILLTDYADRFLPIDLETATTWGRLLGQSEARGRSLPAIDGLILATAHQHNLTVATRNLRDFSSEGIALYDPWTGIAA